MGHLLPRLHPPPLPAYREKYVANLKRDLPHIPFIDQLTPNPKGLSNHPASESDRQTFRVSSERDVFWKYVEAGRKLADLHVQYESQPEYSLKMVESPTAYLSWRVEKMKLSKDKTDLVYNDSLTLHGIPPEAFEYRPGNGSELDWIVDQYRVTENPPLQNHQRPQQP
jgi:predicted helicase